MKAANPFLILFILSTCINGAVNITKQVVLDKKADYVLAADIRINSEQDGRAIVFKKGADGSTLSNPNNHKIIDVNGRNWAGIYIDDADNIVVDGIKIENFWNGIVLDNSNNSKITNCNAINCHGVGASGLYLLFSSNTEILGNTFSSNGSGIRATRIEGSTISNNVLSSNQIHGIRLAFSKNNTISENTGTNNKYFGIYVYESTDNSGINNCVHGDSLNSHGCSGNGNSIQNECNNLMSSVSKSFLPNNLILKGNYPNPFNPMTTIEFYLPTSNHVLLQIYDVKGQLVETLIDEYKGPGNHKSVFKLTQQSSGIFFYKLRAGQYSASRKMTAVK